MKLKEYPGSLFKQFRLRSLSLPAIEKRVQALPSVEAIVSLTTIPSRLHVVDLTIRSLLIQSFQPQKIILWLNDTLKNEIPSKLSSLQGDKFEIRFREGTSSHRKLVFALQEFPDTCVITSDDDLMYPEDWLERLWQEHQSHPSDVIAHECRTITYAKDGRVMPYSHWKGTAEGACDINTLAIGYGGTLYPPHALHQDTTNAELYLALTPKADDLWFKAMAILNNTAVRRSSIPTPRPVPIARSQQIALGHTNIKQDGNREQWQALCDHFRF